MSNPVFVLLLTRLQGSKTDKFSQGLIRFICFAAAIEKEGLDADGVIAMLDGCQPQPGYVVALASRRENVSSLLPSQLNNANDPVALPAASSRKCSPSFFPTFKRLPPRIARLLLSDSPTCSPRVRPCSLSLRFAPGASGSSAVASLARC